MEKPTFLPSLRYLSGTRCHLYVTNGEIYYCNDCPHEFRGKTVPMVDFDIERWCPVSSLTTVNGKPLESGEAASRETQAAPPPAIVSKTHRAECGNVGETGAHGDLGSNAKV